MANRALRYRCLLGEDNGAEISGVTEASQRAPYGKHDPCPLSEHGLL
jgi:hypothetical protein